MKVWKISRIVIVCILLLEGCGTTDNQKQSKPKETDMKFIMDLSTMECYYNNIAKFHEDDASGMLFWKKDKDFWVEYNGIVTLGIDASKVKFDIHKNSINISIPNAEVLGCKVDEKSLTKNSFIYAEDSADIESKDEIKALTEAQDNMREVASKDTGLLASAQNRAQVLLEDYVSNITKLNDVEYEIKWIYLDEESK